MAMRLNGWQRLWVVFSAFCAILAVLAIAGEVSETSEMAYIVRARHTIDAIEQYEAAAQKSLQREELAALLRALAGARAYLAEAEWARAALTDGYDDFADELNAKLTTDFDFSNIRTEHQRRLNELRLAQLKIVGFGLILWALLVGLVYLGGLLVAWIVRGFKPGRS